MVIYTVRIIWQLWKESPERDLSNRKRAVSSISYIKRNHKGIILQAYKVNEIHWGMWLQESFQCLYAYNNIYQDL